MVPTRPIIVGYDPGEEGLDPLSPEGGSGTRLAHLCGLGHEDFLRNVDRVNLWSESDRTRGVLRDVQAARNLWPLLRGRRVVLAGREVHKAFDKLVGLPRRTERHPPLIPWHADPLLDAVVARVPHPSGRNHWWNEAANRSAAERILRGLCRPCVHVEGPDGSGKSRLAEDLGRIMKLGAPAQSEGPTMDGEASMERVDRRVYPGVVSDRSSGLVSELVYGPVLRGGTVVREYDLWCMLRATREVVTFVHCHPSGVDLRANHVAREDEDPEHVARVNERTSALVTRYEEVMEHARSLGCRVIRYDYQTDEPEEVARCVA